MPKVVIYVRVSTDKQADFGMSLDAQQAELERFCLERRWTIADVFVDGGYSGKDTERPAYQRMINRVKAGGINAIVVTKLDRLTRSVRNLCEINEDILRKMSVHLVCVRDGINTFEIGSSLLMHLLAVIGQIERENTSNRVSAAIRHIQDNGGHYGKVPFGKMTVEHPTQAKMKVLVDHPEESIWVQRMTEWHHAGLGPTEIASRLNREGVKPRCGAKWTMMSVYEFLRTHNIHKPRTLQTASTYDRERAYRIALDMRQDGRTLKQIATALNHANLRPLKAGHYSISAVQDLLRGSIYYNVKTAAGLALHLKQQGHSLRVICDKLLAAGFTAPRGGQWYPKTVTDLMKNSMEQLGEQRTLNKQAG